MIMMVTMLLTGLIYPRSTMPDVVKFIGNLIPATYFIRISRGIITKGVGLSFIATDVITLVVYGVIVVVHLGCDVQETAGLNNTLWYNAFGQ